jgi:hypothetical protein
MAQTTMATISPVGACVVLCRCVAATARLPPRHRREPPRRRRGQRVSPAKGTPRRTGVTVGACDASAMTSPSIIVT